MGKKVTTTVYITEEQQHMLKTLHSRSRVPVAEYIRQGIDLVLEKYQEMLPGQMKFDTLPLGNSRGQSKLEKPVDTEVETLNI